MDSLIMRKYVVLVLIIISFFMGVVNGRITLVASNTAISFHSTLIGPRIAQAQGKLGVVMPRDACSELQSYVLDGSTSNFALIMWGGCSIGEKIRRAQAVGFDLVVVYNDYYGDRVLTVNEDHVEGIKIPAVFISRESGEALIRLAGYAGVEVKITGDAGSRADHRPWFDASKENFFLWAVYFIFLLVLLLILQKFKLITLPYPLGRPRVPELPIYEYERPPNRMCKNLVKAMPCVVYNPEAEPNRTDTSCVICLEEFTRGEKLRQLPCYHRFHKQCIDTWLTKQQAFCPMCRQDARKERQPPPIFVSNPAFCRPLCPIMVLP